MKRAAPPPEKYKGVTIGYQRAARGIVAVFSYKGTAYPSPGHNLPENARRWAQDQIDALIRAKEKEGATRR